MLIRLVGLLTRSVNFLVVAVTVTTMVTTDTYDANKFHIKGAGTIHVHVKDTPKIIQVTLSII